MAAAAGICASGRKTLALTPPGTPSVSEASSLLRGSFLPMFWFSVPWKPCDCRRNGRSPGNGQLSEVALVRGGSELPPQPAVPTHPITQIFRNTRDFLYDKVTRL